MIKIMLKKRLSDRSMTQAEFASRTGIRPLTICAMCGNSCTFLKLEHIDEICSTLGCEVQELIRLDFREYLMKNPDVTFRYKKNIYKIHIVGCSIYPQGYAAVISKLCEMNGVNIRADIGNGTVNIMALLTNTRQKLLTMV